MTNLGTNHEIPAQVPPLPEGSFSGRSEFHQLVRDAFAAAASQGWNEMVLSDASFADWPLGERTVVESLQAWAKTGRTITLLARSYDDVAQRHPRFVVWRRTWDHIVTCRRCISADALEVPSVIWSPHWAMQRMDVVRDGGWCGPEAERRVRVREAVGEWLRQSTPAFPATILGL